MNTKHIFSIICIFLFSLSGIGQIRKGVDIQRFAVYDYNEIIDSVPAIKSAHLYYHERLELWKDNLNDLYLKLDLLQKELKTNRALYTDNIIKKKEIAIEKLELDILEVENTYFGKDGKEKELYKTQIQQYKNFVKITARNIGILNDYDLLFDKASGQNILYANNKYNINSLIIKKLRKELNKISN